MSSEELKPLPQFAPREMGPGVRLQAPLSRVGRGPGIVLLVPDHDDQAIVAAAVPPVLKKWAEEGYVAVEVSPAASARPDWLALALGAIRECSGFDGTDKFGLVAYGSDSWSTAAVDLAKAGVSGIVFYSGPADEPTLPADVPVLRHIAGRTGAPPAKTASLTTFHYPRAGSHRFALPTEAEFDYSLEAMSHTRNLTFLKPLMDGPYFDLEAIWDEHTSCEFLDRSVERTMNTMVDEPYVNTVPTLSGGIGRREVTDFYTLHFIQQNPGDSDLEVVSRTIGIDRIVDELICKFTHNKQIDWVLPGIPPTGIKVEFPMTAVVNVRGDRLYHEHIAWDQACLLKQLGLLPDYLPYPHALPDGRVAAAGSRFEYRVPSAGIEACQKLRDRASLPSNHMFSYSIREAPAP